MQVAIGIFELHIPHARSLKDKRAVVRSVRARIRSKFEMSVAEVGLQELHQRARIGAAAVGSDGASLEPLFEEVARSLELEQDASLVGWNVEVIQMPDEPAMDGMKFE
ncbi:MAG TPA: DUF503 domain-containing protein [Thermoanaerobaculia bacterium]|nr:DUF503 domain-containing protein [Thermoanaerobaculia bacterium]